MVLEGWHELVVKQVEEFKKAEREYWERREKFREKLERELWRKLEEWEKRNPPPRFYGT
jgi:hypothetical protein